MRYLIILFLILPNLSFSQPQSLETAAKTFNVGFVPQYSITDGFRFDLDFRLNDKNQWLVVAPQVYINTGSNWDYDINSLTGFGLEAQHRIYIKNTPFPKGFYLAYGSVFNYFSVKDDGYVYESYLEDGATYHELNEDEMTTRIYKVGGNLIVGVQFLVADFFYIDTYLGTGMRFSFDDKSRGLHDYYNDWWGDIGYSGSLLVGGVRFGLSF